MLRYAEFGFAFYANWLSNISNNNGCNTDIGGPFCRRGFFEEGLLEEVGLRPPPAPPWGIAPLQGGAKILFLKKNAIFFWRRGAFGPPCPPWGVGPPEFWGPNFAPQEWGGGNLVVQKKN